MPPPKGSHNNPAGRPPKARALTAILERALAETRAVPESERKVAGKQLIARYVVEAVLTGKVPYHGTTDDGIPYTPTLAPAQWLDLAKWLYTHIDGAPKAEVDLTSAGAALKIIVEYADAPPADDPTDASTPPPGAGGDCPAE